MSRIGKKPVPVPDKVKVTLSDGNIAVEGPLGKLEWSYRTEIDVTYDDENKQVVVARSSDERQVRALHGLTRSLIDNMIVGVTQGYEKRLEIVGVGYNATLNTQEKRLELRVGFANEIHKRIPDGLDVTCPDQTHVSVKGCDKQMVGQFAAEVRAVRKPEPYKGKGIRYENEQVKIKPGKTAT